MKTKKEAEISILSEILRFMREEGCEDKDDFASNLVSAYMKSLIKNEDEDQFYDRVSKIRTNFFKFNRRIKKINFIKSLFNRLLKKKIKIPIDIHLPSLSFYDIFPEIKKIKEKDITEIEEKLKATSEILIQNTLREAFREKGAYPIAKRSKDSGLEVADIEHFFLEIKNHRFSFVVVAKGYRSLKGSKSSSRRLNWEDVSHQITKAYNRTQPNYVIVVSAREPVDALDTEMVNQGNSVGKPNLIIFVPPMDLVRFLIWRNILV